MSTKDKEKMWELYLELIRKQYNYMYAQALLKVSWNKLADYQGGSL